MVEQQNPKEAGSLGSRTFYGGFALILIILALETALFLTKEGDLDKAEWVVLYVGVALVTGIAFWILTPGSTGEVTVEHLGIRLGGGAAIGAAFVLLSNFVSEEPPNHRVFLVDDKCEQIDPAVIEQDGVSAIELEKDEVLEPGLLQAPRGGQPRDASADDDRRGPGPSVGRNGEARSAP